jgi:hypothetical protein
MEKNCGNKERIYCVQRVTGFSGFKTALVEFLMNVLFISPCKKTVSLEILDFITCEW